MVQFAEWKLKIKYYFQILLSLILSTGFTPFCLNLQSISGKTKTFQVDL